MLAQNFKTASDLKISDEEHDALIHVLGMMERGELKLAEEFERGDMLFNMGTQGSGCGTPACIGGWVAWLNGVEQRSYVNRYIGFDIRHAGLPNLYWGHHSPDTTVDQAAAAVRSYLTTGDPRWDLAVPSHPLARGEAPGLVTDRSQADEQTAARRTIADAMDRRPTVSATSTIRAE